jgi:glycosyltransferase involved in cell wall biosynthesis
MATLPIKTRNTTSVDHSLTSRVVDAVGRIENALQEASRNPTPESAFFPLTVVIPVYNERHTIQQVMDRVASLQIEKQIIVVDDGSTDGTREILASYVGRPGVEIVLHPSNQGKGAALKSGFERAQGEIVIVQDADLEYNPQDILSVIQPILAGQCDVCYGSRYLDVAHQDPSFLHRFGNWLLTQLSNWMTSNRLTDMETCYKAIRRSVLKSITIEQRRFGFEPEITAKLARGGHRIVEVPVSYKSRSWSEGKKIGVRDLISTLWCIVRYRFR